MYLINYADKSCINRLTEIAFSAKRFWNYPEEYYDIWKNELTITEDYLKNNVVKTIGTKGIIMGFYSFCYIDKEIHVGDIIVDSGFWLDHMFLEKKYIGKGLGKIMFNDLVVEVKNKGGIFLIFLLILLQKDFM